MPDSTPDVGTRPVVFDPSTWKNAYFPYYVVQALRRDRQALRLDGLVEAHGPSEMFVPGPCNWSWSRDRWLPLDGVVPGVGGSTIPVRELKYRSRFLDANGETLFVDAVEHVGGEAHLWVALRRCAGVGEGAGSGLLLDRRDALHAIHNHYTFPNLSICRFVSRARVDYAADLIFEIDAHDDIPPGCLLRWFRPYIRAAVEAGRRVLEHLVGRLGVDSRYITTSVTRMGARVTVDWRAFGPRRLHQILPVIRHIEHQVFGADGLTEIAARHKVPKVEIDGRMYERSDAPRRSADDSNEFRGPWLRPIGGFHTKSDATFWYRTTPVEHRDFVPERVDYLIRISRGDRRIAPHRGLLWWPEGRHPGADWVIEANPRPAESLIQLFENYNPVEAEPVRPRTNRLANREAAHVTGRRLDSFLKSTGAEFEMNDPEKIILRCLRSPCSAKTDKKATIFRGVVYCCFRCVPRGMSLVAVAAELNIQLPTTAASSSSLSWTTKDAAPPIHHVQDDWGFGTRVITETLPTIEDVWRRRDEELGRFLDDPNANVIVDISEAGLGKSETVRRHLRDRGEPVRIFVAREDAKPEYLVGLPGVVNILGRREGENCTNPAAKHSMGRFESVAKTICSTCPDRQTCGYRAQFVNIAGQTLAMSHGHLPFSEFATFDNDSTIDVIDEDALHPRFADLTPKERHLFTSMPETIIDLPDDKDGQGFGLDDVVIRETRSAATSKLRDFFDLLERRLTGDAIFEAGVSGDEIVDDVLAQHLFRHPDLRAAFDALGQDDLDEHELHRTALVHDGVGLGRRDRTVSLGVVGHPDAEEWEAAPERAEARRRAEADGVDLELAELGAYATWAAERAQPLVVPVRDVGERPLDVLPDLLTALRLLRLHVEMQERPVSRLMAIRGDDGWTLRLWLDNRHETAGRKVIMLSATMTPARAHLLLGAPGIEGGWSVLDLRVARPERRVQVADSFLGKSSLTSKKNAKVRERVFGTVRRLVDHEHDRTGLPVGVFGMAAVMNLFIANVMGREPPSRLVMPFRADRSEKFAELNAMLAEHHMMVGYSYGVAGSNDYHVMESGVRRFIRSVIVMGAPLPELGRFAQEHRGLLADYVPLHEESVDQLGPWITGSYPRPSWEFGWRPSRIAGPTRGGNVPVVANDFGFTDPIADQVLYGAAHAEVLQLAGRMRPHIPDPVDPTMEPRVYYLGGLVVPGWDVDDVLRLDELRAQLGLAAVKRAGGRPSTRTITDSIKKEGRGVVIRKLVEAWLRHGMAPSKIEAKIEQVFAEGGETLTRADRDLIRRHVGEGGTPKPL